MSFFGVELNAQINKLVLNIKLTLGKNKYLPNFRTIYKSFVKYDTNQIGLISIDQFEKVILYFIDIGFELKWNIFQKVLSSSFSKSIF
jgi:hypothetical protein